MISIFIFLLSIFFATTTSAGTTDVTVVKDTATIQSFHRAILRDGHSCPAVKLAFTEAQTSEGNLFMVYCGVRPSPPGTFIGFPALLYRVIKIGQSPLIVVPY